MITGAEAYRLFGRARAKALALAVRRSFAGFGAGTVVEPPLRLAGEGRIVLGADVYIGPGSWLQAIGEPADGAAPTLIIGDGTRVSGLCTISAALRVELGRSVLFARGVYVSDHRHAFAQPGVAIVDQGIEQLAPVVIGDGVWLGEHVVVCPGVTIGPGAVVGANSVVTSDVPAGAIAVGAPARVLEHASI